MAAADRALDQAWAMGRDVGLALEHAKELSRRLGREPLIEDAKLLIAQAEHCTPNEAFLRLIAASQHHNRKVGQLAREIVSGAARVAVISPPSNELQRHVNDTSRPAGSPPGMHC
jgi:hypothetical protein